MITKMTSYLVINGIIEDEEREIYSYGLHQGLLIIINIMTTLFIGFLFKEVWEIIVFMIAYIPLRTYGGGYHAKTELRCYFLSVSLIIASLLLIKFIPITKISLLTLSSISGVVVYIFAPVEDKNKILNEMENKIYKRKTRIILSVEILVALLLYILGFEIFSLIISVAIFMVSLMIIAGRIKNTKKIENTLEC
ncbi:accessory gene regulator ArgB-like protein [Tissierella creatinophila]|nr:accessory gene regulator B family protein [Tissierella creatinophila]